MQLAYTFDAGPNACLFLQEEDVAEVVAAVKQVFPPANENNYIRGIKVPQKTLDKVITIIYPHIICFYLIYAVSFS